MKVRWHFPLDLPGRHGDLIGVITRQPLTTRSSILKPLHQ